MLDPATVAARLRELAAYLEAEEDVYRARAYRRAANAVDSTAVLHRLIVEGRLEELPGVGASLAAAIHALAMQGTTPMLEELRARWPRVLLALTSVPGLGPRKARVVHDALGVDSVEELAQACRDGRVRTLPGFGAASEAKLLAAIGKRREKGPPRLIWPDADELARSLRGALVDSPFTLDAAIAGELRRGAEVIGDLAFAVATEDPGAVCVHLAGQPLILGVAADAPDLARVEIAAGLPVALHLGPPERFGALLARATGSARHWRELEARAAARGVDLDFPDEESLYAALDLPWIPPEIRDGDDEITTLPGPLVTRADVRGAVHCHTTYSDGRATILEMAKAAEALGLEYLTITDHSSAAGYAGGLDVEQLRRQWDEIDDVQGSVGIRLLKGTEADILADGALDWPDEILERFDVIIASIHQRHGLGEDDMTRRLVRAMRLPVFKIWGHALGRMLLRRDPIACRFDEVLDAIAGGRAAIELNGDPHRMDLEPALVRRAQARGIRFVLSSDAHSTAALRHLDNAVRMARRARLVPAEVLNTLPAAEFAAAVRPLSAA